MILFGRSRVLMLASVGNHVAGRKYWLPKLLADKWIVRGYAEGKLSKEYQPQDVAALKSNVQPIVFGYPEGR
jgi:hypothetical protein